MSQQEANNYDAVLARFREDPLAYVDIYAMHTGLIRFHVHEGDKVEGLTGDFRHIKGTLLCELTRERNQKPIHCTTNGEVSFVNKDVDGQFVQAGEKIMTIRHPLKKREIIEQILMDVLVPFRLLKRRNIILPWISKIGLKNLVSVQFLCRRAMNCSP